jgi:hypothetical protein
MRVLLSRCCSLWLSRRAIERARELGAVWASPEHHPLVGEPEHHSYGREEKEERWEDAYSLSHDVPRHDPVLIQVFDELGSDVMCGNEGDGLFTVEVPDDLRYFIGSYLSEWVAEAHRTFDETGEDRGGWPVFTRDSKFVSSKA